MNFELLTVLEASDKLHTPFLDPPACRLVIPLTTHNVVFAT